ncbi:Essential subunit of the histone deacetylase Rpd3S complex [Metarhizium rileyi]|uniref:Essential subunit of the histone deacetylase Rpd3S complex n=1 Tax=Metarhizium rileyi (strain RCEF 4871) TaxID=1649241 RepID=A0A167DZE2_METRR|nr:Essential subunit of the histone deacetylase Rpd3S complex [Metarhizium rileyi RCEF 4871]
MISSSARASRSASRYSSPAQPNGGTLGKPLEVSRNSINEASRSFMQRWLEPSVQNKPSFEEAGLARGGVLENMAPLGALPKAKKAVGENGMPTRKIILKTSSVHPAKKPAERETPAKDAAHVVVGVASPAVSPPVSPLFPPASTNKRKSLATRVRDGEADDDEYDPKGTTHCRRSRRMSLPIKRITTAAATAVQSSPPRERRSSTSIVLKPTTPVKRQARSEPDKQGFTDKVIEAAVDEALKHYRYPTAWALKTLYEEKSGDQSFLAMIQDVFSQTADEETMREFFRQMQERKREGKKDNRGCYSFVPPATSSRFTPHKPMAAPYAHLIHEPEELPQESTTRAGKKAKILQGVAGARTLNLTTPGGKGARAASVGTGKTEKATTGIIRVKTPASRKRARRDSGTSDSSLSSAMSMSSPEVRVSSLSSPSACRGPSGRGAERGGQGGQGRQGGEGGHGGGHGRGGGGGGGGGGGAAAAAAASPPGGSSSTARATWSTTKASVSVSASASASASTSTKATATGAKSQTAPKTQPITTRGKSVTSSKQVVSNSSGSNSPTLHNTRPTRAHTSCSSFVDDASMPGRISAAELFPNLNAKSAEKPVSSVSAPVSAATDAEIDVPAHMPEEDEDSFWDRRRTARGVTNNLSPFESSIRASDVGRESTPVRTTRRTRQSLAASVTTRATRSASKRPNDDVERTVSPIALSYTGDGSSTVASRAATPTSLRPAKRQKTGLRVKTSPVKKKGGAAGVPRQPHEVNSSSLNGFTPKDPNADNDEYCSACGNTGDVVCCDGCPRSFHFECVDMVPSDDLPDEWYCNECLIRRYPSRVPVHRGIFGSALNNLEKSIPRAFSLPKRVQNRFEGVKAGADGDYEEVVGNKTARRRNGTDEPDFFKQREDGQAVLCHSCQKPATQIRSIIPCSVCSFYWHIDCLDPPLAVPPVLKTWRCPAHVDDVLIEVPSLAPAHRFRRVKGIPTITPAFSRGMKNNGHIEIDWTDEPDDAEESGWPDHRSFGRTYKLPAKGVVLDFVEQLRNKGAGYGARQNEPKRIPYPTQPSQPDSATPLPGSALDRKVDEMQVSLSLIGLQQQRSDGVDHLMSALLTATDDSMLALMAKGNAENFVSGQLTPNDRLGLRAMLAQMDAMSTRIRQVLAVDSATCASQPIKAEASSPVTELTTGLNDPRADKLDASMPVTGPTPPSTVDHGEGTMDLD